MADAPAHSRAVSRVVPQALSSSRHVRRAATGWALWLVFLTNAAVIVWLWLNGGGISAVHSWATLLTSLGRITGLLGAYLLLVQVLLIARLRFLESLAGFDRLTIWHRLNGKVCLYLILAHVVFITVGYTLTDRISIGTEMSALLGSYPGMVTATIGTVLIILVAVTSFVIVRQRLRYEAWYLVHLLAYLGILLSWFHELPTGNEFITNPTAASYWTGLYLITLALLVVYRLGQPTLSNLRFRMRVAEVVPEGPGVVSLRIKGRNLESLNARAGQFFLWRFLTPTRWWESHPFSLSEAPGGRSLRITVKDSGDFTRAIASITPGTSLIAEGPYGVFTDAVRRREKVALFAGGIGITPIRALVEDMPGDLALVYRVIKEEDIVFRDELEQLARRRGFALHLVVGHHAAPGGERLMSPEHLNELIPDIAEREIYVCGPPRMADYIEKNVDAVGVPRKYIHIERFAL